MSKFEEFKKKQSDINMLIKNHSGEILNGMFTEVIKSVPNLTTLVLSAYIPSFNDGDACEFSLNVECSSDAWEQIVNEDDYELIKEIVKFNGAEDEFELEDFEDFDLDPNVNIDWHDLYHMFDDYEHLLQKVYGENFRLIVQLQEDDSLVITVKDYECGY